MRESFDKHGEQLDGMGDPLEFTETLGTKAHVVWWQLIVERARDQNLATRTNVDDSGCTIDRSTEVVAPPLFSNPVMNTDPDLNWRSFRPCLLSNGLLDRYRRLERRRSVAKNRGDTITEVLAHFTTAVLDRFEEQFVMTNQGPLTSEPGPAPTSAWSPRYR